MRQDWDPRVAEQLDRDHQRACFSAAKSVRRRPNVAFTRSLASLRTKKNILSRVIAQSRLGLSVQLSLQLHTRSGTDFLLPDDIVACQQPLRQVTKEIRTLSRDARQHRRDELRREINACRDQGNHKKAKDLRRIMVAENVKGMYRRLRSARGEQHQGITRLEVPCNPEEVDYKSCTDWISVDLPQEIEQRLRDRNQRHFGQADTTFPTVAPFSEWVDWGASTHVADLMLDGSFDPGEIDSSARDLVRHMRRQADLDSIPAPLTAADWIGKIQAWPKTTSTSPSGFHLSHSKALLPFSHPAETQEERNRSDRIRQQLLLWQIEMINLAIASGYSYQRWQTVVNVMLPKEANNNKIHRLRVIHLYEHDYNMVLALKWRALIHHSTTTQVLNSGQFGAVPGRDAIMPTIIEELQYEICRASKRPLAHLDYDATACYDRIILSLASLVSRRFGMHRQVVMVNGQTLLQAKYLLKTTLGVSETLYRHCEAFPIYGSGQGAGNSPALWCIISFVLFDVYKEQAVGAYFQSPDGSESVRVHMVGFVDDTSGSSNDFLQPTLLPPAHYLLQAKQDAQRWNNVLRLSGGALQKSKCSYRFLYYDFTSAGLPVARSVSDPKIQVRFTPTAPLSSFKALSAYTPHKTLGVHKAPAGEGNGAFQALLQRNTTHSKVIARSPFDRVDVWTYYHAIYLPSISYPMPSLSLKPSQWDELQRQVKKSLLPKCGYNRNMPNAVVYGPSMYGGLGLRVLRVEQGISQLSSLFEVFENAGSSLQVGSNSDCMGTIHRWYLGVDFFKILLVHYRTWPL